MTMQALVLLLLILLSIAVFAWRSMSRLRRVRERLVRLRGELRRGAVRRREAAERMLDALRNTGYVPNAHKSLQEAITRTKEAEEDSLRALAEADEQLKRALLQVYQGLPPQRLGEVNEAHTRLAEAEDELDILRQQYNEAAQHHNTMIHRLWYRMLTPWTKATRAELYLTPAEEKAFAKRYVMRSL